MPINAPTTLISARPHYVQLQRPAPPLPDGDGGYLDDPWEDLAPPRMFAEVIAASASALERVAVGATVIAQATDVVTMPYHPQLTTKCRILYNGRTLHVVGVSNRDERSVETIAVCMEVVA